MARYWRVYRTFFVSSLSRELEFRANFFAKILQNGTWILFFLLVLLVIYRNTESVAGWSRGDALVLGATIFIMNALASAFFFSVQEIPSQVRMGTLDFVVTRPIDSQFWVSTRKFNFDQIGSIVVGLGMLAVGLSQSGLRPDAAQWGAWLLLSLFALAIFYGFTLILMTTAIWLVRVDNLWVMADSVVSVARFPIDIYPGGVQRLLTFGVPLAFLATVPARQLVGKLDLQLVALGGVWAVAMMLLARGFWRFAMRHYTSASS